MTGYLHLAYAQSLAEFGTPCELPESGGWILERPIPETPHYDAMGCYPLFTCRDWSKLHSDLEHIKDDLVSLALVTDPFGGYDEGYLRRCFRDRVIPFKEHFIVDLSRPMNEIVSPHNRRYAKKGLLQLNAEKCENPSALIDEWINLYSFLVDRHNISGISAFSKESFKKQLRVPGIVMFRSIYRGETVGILLWYVQDKVGYYHLGASSSLGYDLRSSFVLFWFAIEYFADSGLQWLDIGAGAGLNINATDGLSRFKRGWSTGTRTSYFCGRILNHARYSELVKAKGLLSADYFPAYRRGEFA